DRPHPRPRRGRDDPYEPLPLQGGRDSSLARWRRGLDRPAPEPPGRRRPRRARDRQRADLTLSPDLARRCQARPVVAPHHRARAAARTCGSPAGGDARGSLSHVRGGRKGSLEPGKLADLAVLSDNPLTCPEDRIKDITAEVTIMAGR